MDSGSEDGCDDVFCSSYLLESGRLSCSGNVILSHLTSRMLLLLFLPDDTIIMTSMT